MIYRSPLPSVPLTGQTLTEKLFDGLTGRRDDTVMIDGLAGTELTAGALVDGIARLAGGLIERGIKPGEVTAVLAPNMPEYVIACHGPLYAGGTITLINPSYTVPEVAHQLTDSGATRLITTPQLLQTAQAAITGTAVTEIAVMGPEANDAVDLAKWMGNPLHAQVTVDVANHVAALPYSSGTTGRPKGVMLTHRNLVVNIDQGAPAIDTRPGDWTVAFLPFFHIYGFAVLMNSYLGGGANVVTMPRFELGKFLEICQTYRARQLYIVPPVALALARDPQVDAYDLSATRRVMSAAAPLGEDLAAELAERLGLEVFQGYGMTEMSPVSHASLPGQARNGMSGITVPDTECRIVDPETGQDAPSGELWVRGPQIMKGYLNNPDATAETITADGWLRTGDLGAFDADGYLTLHDRLKELIKVKGFQVAPAEVEAALLTHPDIADAAVTGRPDPEAGEKPVAYVVLKPNATADTAGILNHLAERLATYKLPGALHFIDVIPKSPSGKILRRMLPEI